MNTGVCEYMFSTRGMPMRISDRFFISSARFFCAAVIWNLGGASATSGTSGTRKTCLGGDFDEVRVVLLYLVEIALDAAHLLDVFDRALLAGRDDQPLRARLRAELWSSPAACSRY